MTIILELTVDEFNVIQEAMNRLSESYGDEEWEEMPDFLADYNAASCKVEDAARKHATQ